MLYITHDIVKECVRIRRSKKMKTPDALIAVTAIVYNMILLTSDTDFNNIITEYLVFALKYSLLC
ncbi:PIN domain-containing protein [Rhizobium leguminosarum]|nr:PIN domain-containing protein [Rhizobium leguminosarum]